MSRRIHIVGIGGAGMSAIATVLHERGERVSGSDSERTPFADRLMAMGVPVHLGHKAEQVGEAELVLASAAIPADNVELAAAHQRGIPVLGRSQFWQEVTGGATVIAVAGAHGKTTTTGMLAAMLSGAGREPGFIVGGELLDFNTNARAGAGEVFVIEADEYRLAFLGMRPSVAVVTNIEWDHPDQFSTPAKVVAAFQSFADEVGEHLIVCADNPAAVELKTTVARTTYGLAESADWRAEEIRPNGAGGSDFLVLRQGESLGLARSRLPGDHNVVNALGALAAADAVGVSFNQARDALTEFHGVSRRFQLLGEIGGVTVIDDYAHHPTEVAATLAGARQRWPEARLVAVFQPHTFSRTRALLAEFSHAFTAADWVLVTDIYAARETPNGTITAAGLVDAIEHDNIEYVPALTEAGERLLGSVRPGDVVITLSAGDANQVGRQLLEGLKRAKRG